MYFSHPHRSAEKGRRLGYMGHLIKILRHITNCISESEHIASLIASSFDNEADLQLWQSLIAQEGEFTLAVAQQNKLLANCNPHEDNEYNADNSQDFLSEANTWDICTTSYSKIHGHEMDNTPFGRNIDDDDDDYSFDGEKFAYFEAQFDIVFSDMGLANTQAPLNDAAQSTSNSSEQQRTLNEDDVSMTATDNQESIVNNDDQQAEYDNNANVEKASSDKLQELNDVDASATTAATSIVSRLQSVLIAGEDDYEDDEGMWTKPLGGSNQSDTMATDPQTTLITNGPSKIAEL